MAGNSGKSKKKQMVMSIVLGIFSLASYVAIFMNEEAVTDNFTRGGLYLILPVVTAFYFSFLHGSFAHNVLDVFGIEASKRKVKK